MIEGSIVIIGDNNVDALRLTVVASGALQMEHVLDQETAELLMAGTKVSDTMIVDLTIFYTITWSFSLSCLNVITYFYVFVPDLAIVLSGIITHHIRSRY